MRFQHGYHDFVIIITYKITRDVVCSKSPFHLPLAISPAKCRAIIYTMTCPTYLWLERTKKMIANSVSLRAMESRSMVSATHVYSRSSDRKGPARTLHASVGSNDQLGYKFARQRVEVVAVKDGGRRALP